MLRFVSVDSLLQAYFFFPLTLAAGEASIFREFLRSRTVPHLVHVSNKELKVVNLFLRDPSSFHSFWYSHDFVSQDVVGRHSAQHRSVVALDNFRLHLCKITGPNYPIGSGASKTRSSRNFLPAGSNDFNRISCISDFFDFVTNSGMTTGVHFLCVRSLMSPISGSKLSFLFSRHKIYLCLLTFWKPSLRGRRPLYLYDFRSFLCKNELLSFLGLSACKCFLCFRLSWTLMAFFCARLELDVSLLLSCCPRQKTSPKVIWIRRETVFAFLPFSRKSWEWVCGCLVSSDQLCLWSGCPALLSFC